jgi:hypothetical protein
MENIFDVAEGRNSEAIERKFSLPFGFQATFYWGPGELFGVRWSRTRRSSTRRVHVWL